MKRRATRVIVFLLLGAIVNVAVAWGLVLRPCEQGLGSTLKLGGGSSLIAVPNTKEIILVTAFSGRGWLTLETQYWLGEVTDEFLSAYAPAMWSSSFDVNRFNCRDQMTYQHFQAWAELNTSKHQHLDQRPDFVTQSAFGWPQMSLKFEITATHKGMVLDDQQIHGGLGLTSEPASRWNWRVRTAEALPLRPLWPGFAINTVLYAGVLWMLWATPLALRRRRRIRRGLCPACAYPVGTSPVCTECGKPVKSRNVETQKAETA